MAFTYAWLAASAGEGVLYSPDQMVVPDLPPPDERFPWGIVDRPREGLGPL
jgi:hypothetical protein